MNVSRRGFLAGSAAGAAGLVISFYVPSGTRAAPQVVQPLPPPNAFLRIGTDNSVVVVLAHVEMGQGIWTGLSMLIAEELECDWSKVRAEHAPAAPIYAHTLMKTQVTGGSSTTNSEFERYRNVGATAKIMLVRAAATRWKTTPAKLRVKDGVISFGTETLTYGDVAEAAMKLPPPTTVKLKDPKEWKLLGTAVRRLDTPEKITGKAVYGIDVMFAGLRTAVVFRPPAFGSKLVRLDDAAALKIPGVEKVVSTSRGVAVIAKHFWAAKLGRDALVVEWSVPEGGGVSTDKLMTEFATMAMTPGTIAVDIGKVDAVLAKATKRLVAQYDVPYLAHAAMEPLNCAVKIDGDRCEIWAGTQLQGMDQAAVAKILGIAADNVQIHTPFLGGAFGRRGPFDSDFVSEAVIVAKAAGVPVKVVWTREDDTRGGHYRPAYIHRIQVGLDSQGMPTAWDHVVVGQSIFAGTAFAAMVIKNGVDQASIEGTAESPYLDGVKAKRVSLHSPKTEIPVMPWRSVGNTHTAFAMECMIDELAHAASKEPLAYRLELLKAKPRHLRALQVVADKAGWSTPPAAGRARGLAVHECFGTIVAEVAEVSVEGGRIKVNAVTVAVDCGTVINPLGVEAQIQGSVAFGLSAVLHGKITIVGGKVQESNFHDYQVLRINEMPTLSVHMLPSDAKMGGIGEPATAPIAPAVANAVFALTKQRLRSLPLRLSGDNR